MSKIIYKNYDEILTLSKDEFIMYAQTVNIYKHYDFAEFINAKNVILQRMTELGLTENDIVPKRTIVGHSIATISNK